MVFSKRAPLVAEGIIIVEIHKLFVQNSSMKPNSKTKKTPGFFLNLVPLIIMAVFLGVGYGIFNLKAEALLIGSAATAGILAFFLGYTWKELEEGIIDSIARAMPAMLIVILEHMLRFIKKTGTLIMSTSFSTIVVPLIPWSMAGVYMAGTLGVPTIENTKWAFNTTWVLFLNYYGFTSIGIAPNKRRGNPT